MSIVAYAPDDLTVSVTAGTVLAELQAHLAQRGQWLPVDPPHADRVTLGEMVDQNLSGPRRYGHGTIREHLLGIRARLADGSLMRNGGAVVKNAAGYDLCRLFTGARGELGELLEVTFKVQPLPETERFMEARFASLEAATAFVERVDTSPLLPVVLDLHRLGGRSEWTVVAGFAGDRELVDWQCAELAGWESVNPSHLDHDAAFWTETAGEAAPVRKWSVLPSKLGASIAGLGPAVAALVARAGNGVIYYRGGPAVPEASVPGRLTERLREAFRAPGAQESSAV